MAGALNSAPKVLKEAPKSDDAIFLASEYWLEIMKNIHAIGIENQCYMEFNDIHIAEAYGSPFRGCGDDWLDIGVVHL